MAPVRSRAQRDGDDDAEKARKGKQARKIVEVNETVSDSDAASDYGAPVHMTKASPKTAAESAVENATETATETAAEPEADTAPEEPKTSETPAPRPSPKGLAFSRKFHHFAKALAPGDSDTESTIAPSNVEAIRKELEGVCDDARALVTGAFVVPPPPKKKKKRVATGVVHKNKGIELIGSAVIIVWPDDKQRYGALVIGYQAAEDMHKVYFWMDGSVATVSRKEVGAFEPDLDKEMRGLVGLRVFRITRNKTNIPEEAFLVRRFDDKTYQMIFTEDDSVRKVNMMAISGQWGLLAKGEMEVNNNPLVSWSDY